MKSIQVKINFISYSSAILAAKVPQISASPEVPRSAEIHKRSSKLDSTVGRSVGLRNLRRGTRRAGVESDGWYVRSRAARLRRAILLPRAAEKR